MKPSNRPSPFSRTFLVVLGFFLVVLFGSCTFLWSFSSTESVESVDFSTLQPAVDLSLPEKYEKEVDRAVLGVVKQFYATGRCDIKFVAEYKPNPARYAMTITGLVRTFPKTWKSLQQGFGSSQMDVDYYIRLKYNLEPTFEDCSVLIDVLMSGRVRALETLNPDMAHNVELAVEQYAHYWFNHSCKFDTGGHSNDGLLLQHFGNRQTLDLFRDAKPPDHQYDLVTKLRPDLLFPSSETVFVDYDYLSDALFKLANSSDIEGNFGSLTEVLASPIIMFSNHECWAGGMNDHWSVSTQSGFDIYMSAIEYLDDAYLKDDRCPRPIRHEPLLLDLVTFAGAIVQPIEALYEDFPPEPNTWKSGPLVLSQHCGPTFEPIPNTSVSFKRTVQNCAQYKSWYG